METLYTSRLHGFPNLSRAVSESPLTEESMLSLVIVLGSSISLVGLVFAFITYSLFSDLRNLSGTALMNLLAALFMTQLLYVIGVGGVPDPELCIALAFSLQYIRLCVLCWMLAMAHHLYAQFATNLHLTPITDTSIGKRFLRYSLFAWGIPGVLLGASVIIQYREKGGKILDTASLKEQNCWFLDMNAFVYGLLLPSCVVTTTTLVYLIRAACVARYAINMQVDKKVRDKMRRKRKLQLMLFTKITIVLGLIVALGTLTKTTRSEALWVAYHVGQGLQGICVAMMVTCNCRVLKLYTRSIGSRRGASVFGDFDASKRFSRSTSLQLLTWDPAPDPV